MREGERDATHYVTTFSDPEEDVVDQDAKAGMTTGNEARTPKRPTIREIKSYRSVIFDKGSGPAPSSGSRPRFISIKATRCLDALAQAVIAKGDQTCERNWDISPEAQPRKT